MTLAEWEVISRAFFAVAYGTVVRSTVLACLCGIAVWLARKKTAELRYMMWRWTLLSLLALPLLMSVTPALERAPRALRRVEVAASVVPSVSGAPVTLRARELVRPDNSRHWELVTVIPIFYLLVTMVLLARLGYSVFTLRGIAVRGESITDLGFRELWHEAWLRSGAFVKPHIAVSDDISAPVTFEAGDIWILLPRWWRNWDEAKLKAVLTHEMAHVRRGDAGNLLLASVATCLFWFHPLSWFLRRQLSALAEEACDEAVVAESVSPEQYASYLIDFARDVREHDGRVLGEAMAVAGRSSLKKRIERLFARHDGQRGRRVLAAVVFSIFVPALYLTAAARLDEPQGAGVDARESIPWAQWEQIGALSPADAENLAASVAANPGDLNTRMELLLYYGYSSQEKPYTDQLLWFIQHQPSVKSLPMAAGMFNRSKWLGGAAREQIKSAWEKAMEEHSNSMDVTFNAASYLADADPERGLQLIRDAEGLDPVNRPKYEELVINIFTAAEFHRLHPDGQFNNIQITDDTGERLHALLTESNDPELLAKVGTLMVEFNPENEAEQTQLGLGLIEQAIKIDPGNSKWTEALETAKAEPERRLSQERLRRSELLQPGMVRIGSEVAEAALISKVAPVYPSAAVIARIQGSVEFSITVGPDGKVTDLKLMSGHPLFVNPAKDAISKWVYHPATQDGKAIPFVTEVVVPFKLP
jgi:TonB family protein